MAKQTGKTFLIKSKSPLGYKSRMVVHAPNLKEAEKYAKDIHPLSGWDIKVSRYKVKGVEELRTISRPAKTHESTESMVHTSEEKTLDETFTQGSQENEDD